MGKQHNQCALKYTYFGPLLNQLHMFKQKLSSQWNVQGNKHSVFTN